MNIGEVTTNCLAAYDTDKTRKQAQGKDFAKEISDKAQSNEAGEADAIHSFDEQTGDIAVFRALYTDNGSKYTVYKTQDFDPENPVYKVKIWDAAGNVTERMIDVSKVDPKNCDTFEMNVYAAHLQETGKDDFKETVLKAAIAKAASHANQQSSVSWGYSTKINWVDTVRDIMQSAYGYGDLKGYMEWKKFLELLED